MSASRRPLAIIVLVLLTAAACKDREAAAPPAAALADGKRVVGELKRRLVARLTEALAGGPAAAIDVCRTEAPAIAAAVAVDGITIGRATRKPRNPANAAAGWQADALTHFEALHAAGKPLDAPWSRALPGGRTAYAEPLVIAPLCNACHGPADGLAPEVTQILAARYPSDQATGYAPGDLRGIAWAELPAR